MDDLVCEKVKVNQGLNICRIRSTFQMKQETLAQKIGVAQQTLSKYENQEVVDEEVLDKCAKALNVPVDILKNMPANENAPTLFFKDVSFNNTLGALGLVNNTNTNSNYSEKVMLKALQDEVNRLNQKVEELEKDKKK